MAVATQIVPENGMQQLPLQMKSNIDAKYHLNTKIESITNNSIVVNGEQQNFEFVVQAYADKTESFHSVVTDYFITDMKIEKPILYLNASSDDVINHIAPMSTVSKKYAPPGKNLLSVNLIGNKQETDQDLVKKELLKWFPEQTFEHLKRYQIKKSLPVNSTYGEAQIERNGIFYCGDQMQSPSINGALVSGRLARRDYS